MFAWTVNADCGECFRVAYCVLAKGKPDGERCVVLVPDTLITDCFVNTPENENDTCFLCRSNILAHARMGV